MTDVLNQQGRKVNGKYMLSIYWERPCEVKSYAPNGIASGKFTQSSDDLEELKQSEKDMRDKADTEGYDREIKSVDYYVLTKI